MFSHFPVHQCRLWLELWYHTDSSKNNSGKRLSRKISNCPKIQNKMEFHAVCYYFTILARKCPNKKDYIYKMDVSLSILPYWSFLWRLKFMSSLTKMFYIFKTSSWNKETLSNYTAKLWERIGRGFQPGYRLDCCEKLLKCCLSERKSQLICMMYATKRFSQHWEYSNSSFDDFATCRR